MKKPVSLYIHVPFCRRKCGYCSFVSYAGKEAQIAVYVDALKKELALHGVGDGPGSRRQVPTIYFGGGTPSLLAPADTGDILSAIRSHFEVPGQAEITIEANPGTIDLPYLEALRKTGVNRLSLGVQSLDSGELAMLGRLHSAEQAREAVGLARRAGFGNLSLDLIYGLPGADLHRWQNTLERSTELAPDHLSLYALTLDEGTPMYVAVEQGELPAPDPDAAADQYEFAEDFLAAQGYLHYEISNWAKPGNECRHNLAYWKRQPYLGIGVAAHSQVDSHRLANTPDMDNYVAAVASGRLPVDMDEEIGPDLELAETVILGLRLNEGINYRDIWRSFGIDSLRHYRHRIRELIENGLLESDGSYLRLTRRGRLLSNEVFWRFLPDQEVPTDERE